MPKAGEILLKKVAGITLYRRPHTSNVFFYFSKNGKRVRGSTETSNLKQAEEFARRKYMELPVRAKRRTPTFKELTEKYLDYEKNRVKPKTFLDYQRHCRYLIEYFGDKLMESFSPQHLIAYEHWRRDYYKRYPEKRLIVYQRNGKELNYQHKHNPGNCTINREIIRIKSILLFAQNNLKLLQNQKVIRYKMLKEGKRNALLTEQEFVNLKDYWIKRRPIVWSIIAFLRATGLRYPSEFNQLTWSCILWDKRMIVIPQRKGKDSQSGFVVLTDDVINILEPLRDRQNVSNGPNDFIFLDNNGKSIQNIGKLIRNSLKELNINRPYSPYNLRHQYTTEMLLKGVPQEIVASTLGHTDTRMIREHYSHLTTEHTIDLFFKYYGAIK
jgi:integrase